MKMKTCNKTLIDIKRREIKALNKMIKEQNKLIKLLLREVVKNVVKNETERNV